MPTGPLHQPGNVFDPARRKVIHGDHAASLRQQSLSQVTADKTCAARDQNLAHRFSFLSLPFRQHTPDGTSSHVSPAGPSAPAIPLVHPPDFHSQLGEKWGDEYCTVAPW